MQERQLTKRRRRDTLLAFATLLLIALWAWRLEASLARATLATGYALVGAVFFLAAFQLRKKIHGVPIGSNRLWLRAHLIVAMASGALYFAHAGLALPRGAVEATLAVLYWLTFSSGVVGLALSRDLPRQLTRTREQHLFEHLPELRSQVRNEAREATLDAVRSSGSTTLADFYADRLHGFFARPRSLAYALRPTSSTRKRLFGELRATQRYLTPEENGAAERLYDLVRRKDDLDFHASRQGMLRLWLFVHIGLTWGLVIAASMHGVLALAFRGGPS